MSAWTRFSRSSRSFSAFSRSRSDSSRRLWQLDHVDAAAAVVPARDPAADREDLGLEVDHLLAVTVNVPLGVGEARLHAIDDLARGCVRRLRLRLGQAFTIIVALDRELHELLLEAFHASLVGGLGARRLQPLIRERRPSRSFVSARTLVSAFASALRLSSSTSSCGGFAVLISSSWTRFARASRSFVSLSRLGDRARLRRASAGGRRARSRPLRGGASAPRPWPGAPRSRRPARERRWPRSWAAASTSSRAPSVAPPRRRERARSSRRRVVRRRALAVERLELGADLHELGAELLRPRPPSTSPPARASRRRPWERDGFGAGAPSAARRPWVLPASAPRPSWSRPSRRSTWALPSASPSWAEPASPGSSWPWVSLSRNGTRD